MGPQDTQLPTAPTNLAATVVSSSRIDLGWGAAGDNVGVTGYRLERCEGVGCTTFAQVATPTGTTHNDSGLAANTSYRYRVRAVDAAGNLGPYSNIATATTPPNSAPSAVISTPAEGTTWRVDNTISFSGSATDAEDGGTLPASSLTWTLVQQHCWQYDTSSCHGHTIQTWNGVAGGSFVAPDHEYPAHLELRLTATDSGGQTDIETRRLDPRTVSLTFQSAPAGLQLAVGSSSSTTSFTRTVIEGSTNSVSAASQSLAGTTYQFVSWSDGGAATHNIVANTSATYTATFQALIGPTPVAAYGFNEATGPSTADASGNGNVGTIGTATWSTQGRYGNALSFNGTNARVTVADSPSLDLTTGMTLEAWVFPTAGGIWRDVVYKGQDDIYYLMSSTHTGAPATGGTFASPLFGPSALPLNTWSHLAATYDGQTLRLFRDGVLIATRPQTGPINTSTGTLTIGGDALYGQHFAGRIDEVRIYNRALTPAEVQADMNTPVPGGTGETTPPTVAITSPASSAQVSGIVNVTADASDNVGVAGVQFLVDGVDAGVEDANPPYALAWDTRTVSNGAHTLTARARDAAGNSTLSAAVPVNVANSSSFQNEILATGLNLPTSMLFLPDGRLLVAELPGAIKVLGPPYTSVSPTPFLQLTNVGNDGYAGLQQGIFSIALDPNFATNHYYYVFYTTRTPNRDRLSRFTADATLTTTNLNTEVVLYQDPQDADTEHHGGAIVFGNDGKLYFTTGDHFQGSPSQSLTSPRGKIHRINLDGTVPTDNPFYDGNGPNVDSIWARGLRNPFRAYYDAPTGRLYVGDVGGNDAATAKEEVNLGAAGANYGWPNSEGPCASPCTSPLYWYQHEGRDASVSGGFVYHGTQFPSSYQGSYFFADYAQNWIKRLTFDASGNVSGVLNFEPLDGSSDGPYGDIVYLTEGPDGAVYYIDLGYSDTSGTFGVSKIRRIRFSSGNQAPIAVAAANPTAGPAPLAVGFSSVGSSDPEGQALSYAWTFGDGGTATAANPSHTYSQPGQYSARLSVSDGVNTTFSTPISIRVGSPPTATILSPQDGSFFVAGEVISYAGDGTDPDVGTLPASAFTWTIDFLHEGHVHPGAPQTGVKSGTFTIPTSGHDFAGNTRYRITLTVTDSTGLTDTRSVLVYPRKVNLTFSTQPAGLTVYLDGIAKTTPLVYDTLSGFNHTIEARNQTSGGTSYTFGSWSDGGAQTHTISVPTSAQSYIATFQAAAGPTPVAAYAFNEGTGTTVADASGNGNGGTIGTATWSTQGRYGNALSFNGTNARVTVADSPSLDLTTGMTLEAWVFPTAGGNWRDVVYKGQNDIYYLMSSSTGGAPATGGTFASPLFGPSALPLNTWSHLAATYDGQTLRLFRDGVQVASRAQTGPINTSTGTLTIGGDALYGQHFAGRIDEVRVYNTALTATQIQTDMGVGVGPQDTQLPTAPTNLAATATSPTQVNLAWTAASDDVGILQYRIERCQGTGCSTYTEIATATGTTYADGGRSPSTSYTYRVRAQDTALNLGPYSGTATAQTPAPPDQPPTAPTGLAATATSPTQVNLSWTAASDDVGILQYRIERCQGTGCTTFAQIATATGTTYNDTGRSPSTSYSYRVRAEDTALNLGPYSGTATASTPALPLSRPLYLSLTSDGSVGGVATANEDVIFFDGVAAFSLSADGSDVGLSSLRIDAISWLDADTLLFSLDTDGAVLPGVAETVDDSDVIRFDASSLGATTSGTFSMYVDGSDVGLTTTAEDVDALELLTNGNLLLSTEGAVAVTGVTGDDEDLLSFIPGSLGSTTNGTFGLYFDGSDVGLTATGEDVDAIAVDAAGRIYLSTLNSFSVAGIAGTDEDVFVFNPSALGTTTTGTFDSTLYFDGSAFGLDANDLNAIDLPPGV